MCCTTGASKLILSAAVPPEQLYTEGPLHEFPRTVSRLNEMQSREFLRWSGAWWIRG